MPHPVRIDADLLERPGLHVVVAGPPPVNAGGEHLERAVRRNGHIYGGVHGGAVPGLGGH
ncbi:MAG: hypothetical protein ABJC62_04730 [Frankiaceae bacterium]